MSDETDIVNRLRQRATILPGVLPNTAWRGVCAEAADTIARLRAEVEALRNANNVFRDKLAVVVSAYDALKEDGARGLGDRGA